MRYHDSSTTWKRTVQCTSGQSEIYVHICRPQIRNEEKQKSFASKTNAKCVQSNVRIILSTHAANTMCMWNGSSRTRSPIKHSSFTIVAHKIKKFTSTTRITRCEPSEKLRFYASHADQMLNETLHEEAVANPFPSIKWHRIFRVEIKLFACCSSRSICTKKDRWSHAAAAAAVFFTRKLNKTKTTKLRANGIEIAPT